MSANRIYNWLHKERDFDIIEGSKEGRTCRNGKDGGFCANLAMLVL
jgi:hypothetical protein